MRFILGLEFATYDSISSTVSQQFLTPDMRFTCNGMITKWIIAANVNYNKPHTAELQLWRNTTNGVYERINRTHITIWAYNSFAVYEFDNFSPIPFQAGDFLGLYLPFSQALTLYSEDTKSIINYYIDTHDLSEMSNDTISTTSLASSYYHPMVSVEISELGTSIGSFRYTSSKGACSYLSDTRSVISTDNIIISKLNMNIYKNTCYYSTSHFPATRSASVSISSLMVCILEEIEHSGIIFICLDSSLHSNIICSSSHHLPKSQ